MSFTPQLLYTALADPAISVLDDADAATALNVPLFNDFSVASLAALIDTRGLRAPLVFASQNSDQQVAGLAIAALGVINATYATIQTSNPAIATQMQTVLSGLVASAIFSTDDQTAILGLCQHYRCGGTVQASDVTTARAYVAQQAIYQVWQAYYQGGVAMIDAAVNAGNPLPTLQQLQSH